MRSAIVMAAGKGTRMNSSRAKAMHQLLDKPMIGHIYDNLKLANVDNVVVVVGYGKEEIEEYLKDKVEYALQQPQLGTGHAVMQAVQLKDKSGKTLVFNGDCPLIQPQTIEKLYQLATNCDLAVLTTVMNDPQKYGRIVRNQNGEIEKIAEYKDCNEQEKLISEINVGIYCVDNKLLWQYLPELTNDNAQKEYYITDLVKVFKKHNLVVKALIGEDSEEMNGPNTQLMLAQATKWLKDKINNKVMENGVTLIDPNNTYLSKETIVGQDTIIYPNVFTKGKVIIGKGCTITSGTVLENVEIGDHCIIDSSLITDSKIGDEVTVGPSSHLRNGCEIANKVRIGNYVELKNTKLGYNTKCAHLTYLGDSTVGDKVNFGCGVVTVNYDGKNKYHTEIEDGAFIGSNVNLIAPVHIGKNALLAAGSTINKDVADGDMGISRVRQEIKPGYGQKYKEK